MTLQRESIFFACIRSFCVVLFAVAGLGVAIILLAFLGSSLVGDTEVSRSYSVKILPNTEGKREVLGSKVPVILQLNIHGIIGLDKLTAPKVRELLVESREGDLKDDRVKAILLSINSPGGTSSDSDAIYRAIKAYKERYKVPVIAHVDGLAASGGMYIACAADKILASDISLIGSVGVITSPFFNATELLEKVGVEALTIFAGKDKDMLNPFRPWTKNEGEPLHEVINTYYDTFVDVVTRNRPNLDREKLVNVYGANVYAAPEALDYGFIDMTGVGPTDALRMVVKEAQLEGKDYRVVELDSREWLSELFQGKSPLLTGVVKHQMLLQPEWDSALMGRFLYLYRPQISP